jgi:hypothetical protein
MCALLGLVLNRKKPVEYVHSLQVPLYLLCWRRDSPWLLK